ncbi:MAG: response regulator, partial [Geminicoccaceae bacterium]|nr:response regulator [Geminicoccaceae bacterium]
MRRPLVLVADDDEMNRFLCRESLEAAGFDVIEATDGSEALERAGRERPDIILMDVIMSPMDGLTACRDLRRHSTLKNTPLVMMTGSGDNRAVARA